MAENLNQFRDFSTLILGIARDDRMLDAMRDMVAQDLVLDLLERSANRLDLVHDVDAIAVRGDHARNAAHLALDAT